MFGIVELGGTQHGLEGLGPLFSKISPVKVSKSIREGKIKRDWLLVEEPLKSCVHFDVPSFSQRLLVNLGMLNSKILLT